MRNQEAAANPFISSFDNTNEAPTAPLVSVIIPCYNSAPTIRQCLTAIVNQRTAVAFDVTVVDSSADDTPRIVEREFPGVRLIHLDRQTFAGTARNIGIRETRAPYCLMIDSDCVAHPELIERVMARHLEGHYAAIGGSLANGTPHSLSGLIGYLIEFKEFMPSTPERLAAGIPTANITYRREVLERHGCFDEEMQFAEDILLNWKLHCAGEPLLFVPEITVTHLNRTGWRTILSYQIGLGRLSAEARRRGDLPGKIVNRYPVLAMLMPFMRTVRAFQWFARYDKRLLLRFLLIWPLYLLAAAYWSYGFFQGARKPLTTKLAPS